MQKPNNYDTTQAAGEFEPIKLGGHKMVIKQVSEKKSQGGLDMLVILFDFAEGDEQAGYFMKQFENDIRPDKKYPNAGTNYMVIDESVDYGVRNLKTFITCVEKSNPGFAVKWGDNFGQQFKGKLIGGIFRLERDWYDNKEVKRHKLAWFRSVERTEQTASREKTVRTERHSTRTLPMPTVRMAKQTFRYLTETVNISACTWTSWKPTAQTRRSIRGH